MLLTVTALAAAAMLAGCSAITGQAVRAEGPSTSTRPSAGPSMTATGGLTSVVTGSPTVQPHVVVTLTVRTSDGADPTSESLSDSAEILRERARTIKGAAVTVVPPRELQLTAPGSDTSIFDALVRRSMLNIRPVLSQWVSPDMRPTTTDITSDTAGTTTGITPDTTGDGTPTSAPAQPPSAGTPTGKPPASVFPAGSDPTVPVQPQDANDAGWQAAAQAYANGGGPTCTQIDYYQGMDDADKPLLACDQSNAYVYLLDKTLIPGSEIDDAESTFNSQGGQGWTIDVTFKSAGLKVWLSYTTDHVGAQTAFTLDGQVLSAPTINEPITTPTTMVSGSFTEASAKSLADSLKSGALPLDFEVTSRQAVG